MFEKIARPVKKTRKTKSHEMPQTIAFLTLVKAEGARLSYSALCLAARHYGEDTSGQMPGQRGSTLVKSLKAELQPWVCQKGGGYAKGVEWGVETPADLKDRPVIDEETVDGALETARKAAEKAASEG
jgi:hypothetical protein